MHLIEISSITFYSDVQIEWFKMFQNEYCISTTWSQVGDARFWCFNSATGNGTWSLSHAPHRISSITFYSGIQIEWFKVLQKEEFIIYTFVSNGRCRIFMFWWCHGLWEAKLLVLSLMASHLVPTDDTKCWCTTHPGVGSVKGPSLVEEIGWIPDEWSCLRTLVKDLNKICKTRVGHRGDIDKSPFSVRVCDWVIEM